jgi:hypothetical protein
MDNSFAAYLLYLELVIFFSGYPLCYALLEFISGKIKSLQAELFLSYSYAFSGTLYIGLQFRKWYYASSYHELQLFELQPFLTAWAFLSLLFWLPFFRRKAWMALLHSFVFFFLFLRNLFSQVSGDSPNDDMLRNNMKIYSISLLLHSCIFLLVLFFFYISRIYRQRKSS